MLYPKNNEKMLSKELFQHPTSEYRGAPFWAWNSKLDKELLFREIDQLKAMGMGGFHIHCRSGLETEYLGDEFMDLAQTCNERAKQKDMLCWLYDEDRWPSGAAGGLVTKDHAFRARALLFTTRPITDMEEASDEFTSSAKAGRSSEGKLLARYEVILQEGLLTYYKRLQEGVKPQTGAKIWYAYLAVSPSSPWFNNQAYVNTLDPEAIKKFVEITHERYFEKLGSDFGKSIPAIFTDEPQFAHKQTFGYADEEKDVILPYTDDFDASYHQAYGDHILDYIPELFWELPYEAISIARYRYHDHVSERFSSAFADTIGNWCKEHDIMLTGHMMEEPTLMSQTAALGEAMRSYRSFQLPGIDMLCDWREFTTAKQAQSASHQYGCPGVLSELYGVTNWDFDFRGHKLAGDWQAALGVTVRVHHLNWVSMAGESKRDYPASIGYQSPWYLEYPLIEDHFSRLNTALTRGKTRSHIGVIHPIESYWLHWGPKEQTALIRDELETNFKNITEWLLFGLADFDFISESLLPTQCSINSTVPIMVGKMEYDVIIVPGCETLRSTTVERLESFVQAGGTVIFIGDPAHYVDASPSVRVSKLAAASKNIQFSKSKVLDAIEAYRDIDIREIDGSRTSHLIYQMREDEDKRWLFVCHVWKMQNPDIASIEKIELRVKGSWKPILYDTMSGDVYPISSHKVDEETRFYHEFSQHDSLLICLEPGEPEIIDSHQTINSVKTEMVLADLNPVAVTLSEPNVLLLDMAEYSFDHEIWQSREEILRIDNAFRKKLGYPLRMEAWAQPWVDQTPIISQHTLSLKFTITSEIPVLNAQLAMEHPETVGVSVNGVLIDNKIEGWYVDESIKKLSLPMLVAGENIIILKIPFSSKTNIEWCYLLGDFGVVVMGSHAKLISPVRRLSFGDWTCQGLPFYAGNVTYHCTVRTEKENVAIEIPQFRNTLLSVSLDGRTCGKIAFAPYLLNLGKVTQGEHTIDITAFGNRVNAFGAVHNANHTDLWFGPNMWRTTGTSWAYEYQLKKTGILISPKLWTSR